MTTDFSIIIPAKNELPSMKRNLRQFASLKGVVTYEVIVADGASTDGTIEYAKTIVDKVVVKTKSGRETIGEGRNRGAAVARGEVLVFFDAGVRVSDVPNFFTEVKQMFEDTAIVAATVRVTVYPEFEQWQDKIVHTLFNAYIHFQIARGKGISKGEVQIIRRDAFNTIGGFNETLFAAEDFDLYTRLSRIGKIRYLGNLRAFDDPRRFREYGYPKVLFRWFRNFVWLRLFGRAYDREWERVG